MKLIFTETLVFFMCNFAQLKIKLNYKNSFVKQYAFVLAQFPTNRKDNFSL